MDGKVEWFKVSTGIFGNPKIQQIRDLPDGNNIFLVWFGLLAIAARCNNNGLLYITKKIPYTEASLASELKFNINTIRLSLATFEEFDMIYYQNDFICISGWLEHQSADGLDKIREQARIRQENYRRRQKEQAHFLECEKSSEEDKQASSKLFEALWRLYPIKRGKAQVTEKAKLCHLKIGEEHMRRCIFRYVKELEENAEWLTPKNGNTFFNTGYIDYLDDNYKPLEKKAQLQKQNKFNNFHQRDYDFDEYEKKLMNINNRGNENEQSRTKENGTE